MFAALALVIGLALFVVSLVYFSMASCASSTEFDELLEVKKDKEAIKNGFTITGIIGFVGVLIAGAAFGIPWFLARQTVPIVPIPVHVEHDELLGNLPSDSLVHCNLDVSDKFEVCTVLDGVPATGTEDARIIGMQGKINAVLGDNLVIAKCCRDSAKNTVLLTTLSNGPAHAPIFHQFSPTIPHTCWDILCTDDVIDEKIIRNELYEKLMKPEFKGCRLKRDGDVAGADEKDVTTNYGFKDISDRFTSPPLTVNLICPANFDPANQTSRALHRAMLFKHAMTVPHFKMGFTFTNSAKTTLNIGVTYNYMFLENIKDQMQAILDALNAAGV